MTSNNILFSIDIRYGGFTDKLMQFCAFYKLGRSLGYQYHHIRLFSSRSSDFVNTKEPTFTRRREIVDRISDAISGKIRRLRFDLAFHKTDVYKIKRGIYGSINYTTNNDHSISDIFDYLGLNEYFARGNTDLNQRRLEIVIVPLSDRILHECDVRSFGDVQNYVRSRFPVTISPGRTIVIVLQLTGNRKFFSLINSQIRALPDGPDLRTIYFLQRQVRSREPLFSNSKLKFLVHIRQGDTAVLKMPWKTYVPLWNCRLTEYNEFSDIPSNRLMRVEEYYNFVSNISGCIDHESYSWLVFSDGFGRAFRKLGRNIRLLKFTRDQITSLRQYHHSYEKEQFEIFNTIPNCNLVVGEEHAKLDDLVQSCLIADVVVVGTHQRMISKLFAAFSVFETLPVIIVLYRNGLKEDTLINYYEINTLGQKSDRFIYVNLDQPNYPEIICRLKVLLGARFTVSSNKLE